MNNSDQQSQQVFRKLLSVLSRPGYLETLPAQKNYGIALYDATVELLLCLLDGEVTFCIAGGADYDDERKEIALRSLAASVPAEEADYIVIPSTLEEKHIEGSILRAKVGTLIDPDQSATIVMESVPGSGQLRMLTGPGIDGERAVRLNNKGGWMAARDETNAEFPLGVDFFCVFEDHNVLGIPRSTRMTEVEPWDM